MELFNTQNIILFMLRSLGYESKPDLFENLYLKAIIDSFERIASVYKKEEEIRDRFVRDLETQNPLTRELIQKQFLFLNWEKWINNSDTEKSRVDICFSISGFEFVLECKRLTYADKAYLDEGILRFVEGKYADKDDYAGMIGFIVQGNPEEIVKNLKTKVREFHPAEGIDILLNKTCADHKLSFQSRHLRFNQEKPIHVFHLFFDFREE